MTIKLLANLLKKVPYIARYDRGRRISYAEWSLDPADRGL